jgi:hypothetical protein
LRQFVSLNDLNHWAEVLRKHQTDVLPDARGEPAFMEVLIAAPKRPMPRASGNRGSGRFPPDWFKNYRVLAACAIQLNCWVTAV